MKKTLLVVLYIIMILTKILMEFKIVNVYAQQMDSTHQHNLKTVMILIPQSIQEL